MELVLSDGELVMFRWNIDSGDDDNYGIGEVLIHSIDDVLEKLEKKENLKITHSGQ
jgi:hypothetical protein